MNTSESFLNKFQLLTPKQKKIFKYLQFLSKNYRNVFPSHQEIADACECHRDTVIECLKKFSEWGWTTYINRCYRRNLYFMNEELIHIDIENPEAFKRNTSNNSKGE